MGSLPLGVSPSCGLNIQTYPEWVEGAPANASHLILSLGPGWRTSPLYLTTLLELRPYHLGGETIIIGGSEGTSTLIFRNQEWIEGPLMPTPLIDFCSVQLNSTHTLIVGG